MFTKTKPIEHRFWSKVTKGGGNACWIWTGNTNLAGYGRFWNGTKMVGAHRFSFAMANGPFDESLFICHRCDTPGCVNPSHLFSGTNSDNMKDCTSKGRLPKKFLEASYRNHKNRAAETHCINGHKYNPEEPKIKKNRGLSRVCRICRRVSQQKYKLALKNLRVFGDV